jgi:hypothetical protein
MFTVRTIRRPFLLAATLLFLLTAALSLNAQISYSGDTTGQPTFHRPLPGIPPEDLSSAGTSVPYHTYAFTPTETGLYSFFCQADSGQDPFLALYRQSFNALSALTNCVIANDDLSLGNFQQSGFRTILTAGTPYVIVTTGFANDDFGAFSNNVSLLSPLQASLEGTTLTGSRWNRPNAGDPPTTLSGFANSVRHEVIKVEAVADGHYFFRLRTLTSGYDSFIVLYQNQFDLTAPLTNILLANDNDGDAAHSAFEVDLQAGIPYFFVTTGYDNIQAGDYHLDVCGPGAVTLTLSRRISGTLSCEDVTGLPLEATAVLRPSDNSGDLTLPVSVNAAGGFALSDVPARAYHIKVKTANTLSRVVTANTTGGDVSGLAIGPLKGGDADDSNFIDVFDLDLLIQSFNSLPEDSNWSPGVDFDRSGSVDVFDLDILIRNFNEAGEDFS